MLYMVKYRYRQLPCLPCRNIKVQRLLVITTIAVHDRDPISIVIWLNGQRTLFTTMLFELAVFILQLAMKQVCHQHFSSGNVQEVFDRLLCFVLSIP